MVQGVFARLRSLWRGVRRRSDVESEMNEEFALHVELRARDLEHKGMSSAAALRRARQEFGSAARYQEEGRAARWLHRVDQVRFSWLDFKLGFRMLARYPGLTLVGCSAMAVAIALGTLYFEVLNKWQHPELPLPDGNRIVAIGNVDVRETQPEWRLLHDFALWQKQVRSIEDLGAALQFERNLRTEDNRIEPVRGAEMTASTFRLTRIAPVMGRTLLQGDENPAAAPVAVIGYKLWQTRFAGDPNIIGKTVKLGRGSHTIVGVMPEGFGFPVRQHIWLPLRVDGGLLAPRSGPSVGLFGRLAPGVSVKAAQVELDAIGLRSAADFPLTHKNLRPLVTPYGEPVILGGEEMTIRTILYSINLVFGMLLVVVCANVATLVFARTATRGWEIVVRNALGASRARILSQLFVEALVLAGIAALVGLGAAKLGLSSAIRLIAGTDALPFWVNNDLSGKTVLYTVLLSLIGASIVGILPGLRVTRPGVQEALRNESAARAGLRFGGFWTGVIVVQVAITVAFLPLAAGGAMEASRFQKRADALHSENYLAARVAMDPEGYSYSRDTAAWRVQTLTTYRELERRLAAEPGVEAVAFADRLPGMDQIKYPIVVDTTPGGPTLGTTRTAAGAYIAAGYFEAFHTSVIAGRDFVPSDFESQRVVIVNQSFAHYVLGDRNPIGQRVRLRDAKPDEWLEIVGLVKDFGWAIDSPAEKSAMFHPRVPGTMGPASVALRIKGDAEAMGPRLRAVATAVDPTLRLTEIVRLDKIGGAEAEVNWALTMVAVLVSFIVLLLSATGIHSLMAFTVARRTREIGIRTALGAHPRRIVSGIFSRAFLQLSIGVLAGAGIATITGDVDSPREFALMAADVAVMLIVGLAACAVPLRRALRIDPTEALRMEG